MPDNAPVTAPEGAETPVEADAPTAVPATPDELTTLKSRNSGLNSKVGELQRQLTEERAARTAAEQAAADKAGTDDVLNKRIKELEADIEAGKQAVALATKGAQYPESFRELGEDIAGMSTEKLAALEARLSGAKDEGAEPETAKPIGNNAARNNTGPKNPNDMSREELRLAIAGMSRADFGLDG